MGPLYVGTPTGGMYPPLRGCAEYDFLGFSSSRGTTSIKKSNMSLLVRAAAMSDFCSVRLLCSSA